MDRDGALYHAGVGATVTVLTSVLPFSSVLGGAVASSRAERGWAGGFGIGALAGVLAAIPLLVLFVPALAIAIWLGFGIQPGAPGFEIFLAVAFGLFLVYTIGLSALGGVLGVWLSRYTDWELPGYLVS